MADDVELKLPHKAGGIGRFLYTQNPFYLISCGFVLYGLQVAAAAMGDQFLRASFLTSSLAIYTGLMAVTAIVVVRWGKIWQDARTILLVIVIGQIAYSIAVDQLCISNSGQATMLLGLGAAGSILVTEFVLRLCRIQFPLWYRLPYYAIVGVFYLFPIVAGRLQAQQSVWTNWSALVFSILVGGGLLLLIPAVRSGKEMAKDNGTPWNWPLFPLSLFFILAVLAGLRSYAVWMSFGSLRGAVSFEPLLFMPLILAGMVLGVECLIANEKRHSVAGILAVSPFTLLCGFSSFAQLPQPMDVAVAHFGGSSMTVAMAMLIAFYVYTWCRGVAASGVMFATTLFAIGVVGEEPAVIQAQGFGQLAMLVAGCGVFYLLCQLQNAREWTWLGFTAMTGVATIRIAAHFDHGDLGVGLAGIWVLMMFMLIGWLYDSDLAKELRRAAGVTLIIVGLAMVSLSVANVAGKVAVFAVVAMAALSTTYLIALWRRSWIYVVATQVACLVAIIGIKVIDGSWLGAVAGDSWQLKIGAACFCIGVVITSAKTGVYERKWKTLSVRGKLARMERGF